VLMLHAQLLVLFGSKFLLLMLLVLLLKDVLMVLLVKLLTKLGKLPSMD